MWLTGGSLQTLVLSSFDRGNPSHFFGSGQTTTVCCRTSTWLLPLATAKHPVEEEFSFISQMLPLLKPAASMMQQKSSKLLIAYACASWVSQTPNVIITAWLQCNSSSQFAWPSKKSFLCPSQWVKAVVETGRTLLSGDKPRGHFGLWGSCCRDAKPQLGREEFAAAQEIAQL